MMVPLVGPDGRPVESQIELLQAEVERRIFDVQAEALHDYSKDEATTVIVAAMEAALFAISPLTNRVVDHHPEMIGRYEFASVKPRGGGEQHELRAILSGLHHDVRGKKVVFVDPCCETGGSWDEFLAFPEVRDGGATEIQPLFFVVKTRFKAAHVPLGLGDPYRYEGGDYLIGGRMGLDINYRLRELPDLRTCPPGTTVDLAALMRQLAVTR